MRPCLEFILILWGGAFLVASSTAAQENEVDTISAAPAIVWDFGYLPQKSEVSHAYYICNLSGQPMTVTKIKAGCSCTTVSELKDPVGPGDSAAIVVTFNSGRYQDKVKKTTKVYIDNAERESYRLVLRANVIKDGDRAGEVDLEPRRLKWRSIGGAVAAGADSVTLVNHGTQKLAVTVAAGSLPPSVTAQLPPALEPGGQGTLIVKRPSGSIAGQAALALTVVLAGSDTTLVTVPIILEK